MSPMRPASSREREKAIELAKEYLRRRKTARWDETSDTWLKAARDAADVPDQLVPYFLKLGLVQLDNQRRRKQGLPIVRLPMVPQSSTEASTKRESTAERAASLLVLLRESGDLNLAEMRTKLRMTDSQLKGPIDSLLDSNQIYRVGTGHNNVRYRLAVEIAEMGEV